MSLLKETLSFFSSNKYVFGVNNRKENVLKKMTNVREYNENFAKGWKILSQKALSIWKSELKAYKAT